MMQKLGFLVCLVIGLILVLCLVMVFPFIGDRDFSDAMPGHQDTFTQCTNWEMSIGPNDDPHKYDYNPSIETCRGNITGPDYYRKAIEGCCKYKYGSAIP